MQFMVQGAWGIVPVHLNELSPGEVRGTFPGFAYQLGNLFAANTAVVEAQLADHLRDASGHVTDEDGVRRELEQTSLARESEGGVVALWRIDHGSTLPQARRRGPRRLAGGVATAYQFHCA